MANNVLNSMMSKRLAVLYSFTKLPIHPKSSIMFLKLNHQSPDVYTFSKKFVLESYKLTKHLPPDEKFGMISQKRRAALSVQLNIAEGSSRKSNVGRKRYYEISICSIVEIDAASDIANDLKYLDNIELSQFEESMIRTFKLLGKLISQTIPH